ncbi:uncharacterized protein KQ657_003846 [Scheffersomyces spartinae]|uniref:Pyridoxal phosphate homeostasis protein n=1 Tax=Scheffersomyces spartinae TaxID=45513 RepID=A0A9P7VCJ9_9ASCO|nr:uncharacterized protein KQ657_003846 [Scheffersomyces spartinae]KAG7195318.1 hypothetical protein KQ657_003846 [Scheffersomyces spartinae]
MSVLSPATSSRKTELITNYNKVLESVRNASSLNKEEVKLIAVSKYKPAGDILALYEHGVRHFGENYVQELCAKAAQLPKDICWHFIGGLQSGKCKDLAKNIPNLFAVESIDSLKKCQKLENARNSVPDAKPIGIFLQINTSNESQKSGYLLQNLEEVYETVDFIKNAKYLNLIGLMTIGSVGESLGDGDTNKEFERLVSLKAELDAKYGSNLRLSMGMSNDFEQAIKQGSTQVRVGSKIFGSRPSKA